MPFPVLDKLSRIPAKIDIPDDGILYRPYDSFIDQCYSLLSNCFVAFVGYMYIMYLQDCHTKNRLFTDNMY